MKERGIIFNAEMVRAILEGRKTQTRRLVNSVPTTHDFHGWIMSSTCAKDEGKAVWAIGDSPLLKDPIRLNCPLGKIGDRLWVRETWQCGLCTESTFAYKATHKPTDLEEGWNEKIKWRPSSQMPRWASRILLEITGVRVERLQSISEEDAKADGFDNSQSDAAHSIGWFEKPIRTFRRAWENIYGADGWDSNPWVWVIEFKQIQEG
ncbi:hypothetical protein [Morganella morganii]|uniref:hypothetical protein n=1 Tax=Morganella morganii TaxID=582 RepID=UPI0034D4667A